MRRCDLHEFTLPWSGCVGMLSFELSTLKCVENAPRSGCYFSITSRRQDVTGLVCRVCHVCVARLYNFRMSVMSTCLQCQPVCIVCLSAMPACPPCRSACPARSVCLFCNVRHFRNVRLVRNVRPGRKAHCPSVSALSVPVLSALSVLFSPVHNVSALSVPLCVISDPVMESFQNVPKSLRSPLGVHRSPKESIMVLAEYRGDF